MPAYLRGSRRAILGGFVAPRIAALDYTGDTSNAKRDLLAKYPIVVRGFTRGQLAAAITHNNAIKAINPNTKIFQYVILNEVKDPQISSEDRYPLWQQINAGGTSGGSWWAKDTTGAKTQWTTSWGNYEVNITNYVTPNAAGKRFPEVKADFDWTYYLSILGNSINGIFQDNLFWRPRKAVTLGSNTCADYDLSGTNDSILSPTLQAEYRASFIRYFDALKAYRPDLLIVGNSDVAASNFASVFQTEYFGKLDGAYLEALVGKSYSVATYGGIDQALIYYRSATGSVKAGGFVSVNTYVDNSAMDAGEYSTARYGLCMTLFDAGYYTLCADNVTLTPVEIDEFAFLIGNPVDTPPSGATENGIWKREYENGCAVLNPAENGGKYFQGNGFTLTRNGAGTQVTLTGTWVHNLSVGNTFRIIRNRTKSSFNGTFTVATVNSTTSITWNQAGTANETDAAPNGTIGIPKTINFTGAGFRKGTGTQDATMNDGSAVGVLTLFSGDAVLLIK